MAIEFKTGNILDATETLICHQVNYKKVMGSELAKQIKNKWDMVFSEYCEFINRYSWNEITTGDGRLNVVKVSVDPFQCVVNIFGQFNYGNDATYTRYDALKNQLLLLRKYASTFKYSIACPWKLSCGLAGGDWDNIIYNKIGISYI